MSKYKEPKVIDALTKLKKAIIDFLNAKPSEELSKYRKLQEKIAWLKGSNSPVYGMKSSEAQRGGGEGTDFLESVDNLERALDSLGFPTANNHQTIVSEARKIVDEFLKHNK